MKKLLFLTWMFSLFISPAKAQIEFEEISITPNDKLQVVGFLDYYPYGEYKKNTYEGVFKPFIEEFVQIAQYKLEYSDISKNYEDIIRKAAKGEGDVILGMYSETSLYADLKIIYPAAIDNPIHIVMLPSKIKMLHSLEDLKSFKGGIHSKEHFSDYVNLKLKDYKIEYIDNSYELYGKLIRGEIDYIFTGIYFGTIETTKLGIRHMVAFSKQSVWNIPMFIGISKLSRHREYLSHKLSKMLENPKTRQKIQEEMLRIVKETEDKYRGTVPPTYILKP